MVDLPRKTLKLGFKFEAKEKVESTTDSQDSDDTVEKSRPIRRSVKRRIIHNDAVTSSKPKPTAPTEKFKKRTKPRKNKKKALVSPSDLKAQALDERLKAFDVWSTYKPLAVGVDKAIFKLVNDEAFAGASKKVVQKLLRMHTNHARYLQALSRGGMRYQLDGTESETVNDYQIQLATETQAKRAGR